MKVFLGGTCNGSTWRSEVIELLEIDYFDPVVKDWTQECQVEELRQRELCDYILYVITPLMKGVYSIAEAVDDSNKQPEKTIFCVYDYLDEFSVSELKSLQAVSKMIISNGGKVFNSLKETAVYLNYLGDNKC